MKRSLLLVLCLAFAVVFSGTGYGQDIDFALAGAACGGTANGSPGDIASVPVEVVITAPDGGVAGWSLSISGEGEGLAFNPDPVASCFNDCLRELLGGKGVQFHAPGIVDPEKEPDGGPLLGMGPQGPGIVVGAVLAITPAGAETLDPGSSTVLEFIVDLPVPDDEAGVDYTISFKDGLQGTGTPTPNSATVNNVTITPTTQPCVINVAPAPAIVDMQVTEVGTGNATVDISSEIDDPEGVAGWQVSLSYSDNVGVTGASVASGVLDALGVTGVDFEVTEFSPDVDPDLVFEPSDPPDSECELEAGSAQGNGLVSGVIFDTEPNPGDPSFLPGNTGGFIAALDIQFDYVGDPALLPTTGRFDFVNCLEGSGVQIRNRATVKGRSIPPRNREGADVTFPPLSQFIRGDANDDGVIGDLSDALFIIEYQFMGGAAPACDDSADANADTKINIADPVWIINAMFRDGPAIPPPSECETSSSPGCPNGIGACM